MNVSITKRMSTETGHRLTNYDGKCAHLHGHTYRWELTVERKRGGVDDTGFVTDFKVLKQIMEQVIGKLDHAFLFHCMDPLVIDSTAETARKQFAATTGETGRVFVLSFNPTVENILQWVSTSLHEPLRGKGLDLKRIKCWETVDSFAELTFY